MTRDARGAGGSLRPAAASTRVRSMMSATLAAAVRNNNANPLPRVGVRSRM